MSRKDITEILKELDRQGFELKAGDSGHWKVYDADGHMVASLPASPAITGASSMP